MKHFTRSKRLLRSLFFREDGAAMTLIGLGAMALIAAVGIAIDMGRVQVVQSRLSNALDAAGLAAGNAINSGNTTTITVKYFWANFPSGYMGSSVNDPTVAANVSNTVLTLDVAGTVPTTFMRVFGVTSVPVSAHSEITRANMGMELALVLDTTGSMDDSAGGGLTKIQAAKNAATDLINILYGDESEIDNLWVGLVPFAQAVNVGTDHAAWTSNPTSSAFTTHGWGPSPSAWGGCVDAREASNRDVTDDPPTTALFPKYYWPDDSNNNWISTSTDSEYVCYNHSYCTCANYGPCSCTTSGNTQTCVSCTGSGSNRRCTESVTTTSYNITSTRGPNKYCSQAITPLTANKNTVLTAINSLNTDGNTHIVLGAAWGWRLLSPNWRNLWGGEMDTDSLPQDYGTPLMTKVMILMTDGDNTISNSTRGAYWYLSDGKLGTTNSTAAVTQLNNRLTSVCNSMKANDILIYTIAFGTDISATAQSMLQSCATSTDYYFYAPNAATLSTAFHQIADSLANLRISQ